MYKTHLTFTRMSQRNSIPVFLNSFLLNPKNSKILIFYVTENEYFLKYSKGHQRVLDAIVNERTWIKLSKFSSHY
jgi:hypothetical protein